MAVYRIDRAKLNKAHRTDSGALVAPAKPTRTGIFIYRNADGSERREYRPDSTVFNKDALDTLAGAPVTIGHPGSVTAQNWKTHAVGHVRDVDQDGQFVTANIRVDDATAAAQVEAGTLGELSCGYMCEYDPKPGTTPSGERFDGIQRNVRYNHLALLPPGTGRAGPECSVRLDGNDYDIALEIVPVEQPKKDISLPLIPMDPKELERLINEAATAKAEAKAEKTRADAAEGKVAALESQIRKFESERVDQGDLEARVDARVELLTVARAILPKEYSAAGKTDHAIRLDCVAKLDKDLKLDGKGEEYVKAVFDTLSSKVDRNGDNTRAALEVADKARVDGLGTSGVSPVAEARKRQAERNAAAYKAHSTVAGKSGMTQEDVK